jgi:hypothetical protein
VNFCLEFAKIAVKNLVAKADFKRAKYYG